MILFLFNKRDDDENREVLSFSQEQNLQDGV